MSSWNIGGAVSRQIGSRYELLDQVGRGAMGEVWRAQTADGGLVAVKILRAELTEDPKLVARFLREKELLTRVQHPAVVRVRDLVIEGERLAIVMDLVDGVNLRQLLTASAPLDPRVVADLVADVADGLTAVHAAGIVHRDVKSENVLIDSSRGHALVSDFGISALVEGSTTRMTKLIGSPEYMAPEIAERTPATSAADVYSLGIVLFELLAGVTPFAGGHELAILDRHRSAPRPRLPWAPEPLTVLLERMLARDPDARPSAAEVASTLRALPLDDLGPQALLDPGEVAAQATPIISGPADADEAPTGPGTLVRVARAIEGPTVIAPISPPRRRRRLASGAALALTLVVLAGIVTLTFDPSRGRPPLLQDDRLPPVAVTASNPDPAAGQAPPVETTKAPDLTPGAPAETPTTAASTPTTQQGDPATPTAPPGEPIGPTVPSTFRLAPPVTVATLAPTADTYVNYGAPSRNFGPGAEKFTSELFSNGEPGTASYLRFRFPPAPPGRKLTDAVLVIRTTTGTSAGSADPHPVWIASDDWVETTVTWNTRPPLAPGHVGVVNAPRVDTAYEIPLDVSKLQTFVGAQGTLAIANTNRTMMDNLIFWGTKFERKDQRVKLVLTFR